MTRRTELALVVLVAAALYVPGLGRYSLVDPWETHYGEVGREMLQNHDLMHTTWSGTQSGSPNDVEGFRSKPVLSFWLIAGGLTALRVATDGGYSGELVEGGRTMIALRLPFVLCAIAGLVAIWWMLAKLVDRRLAWLALLVVGSSPMFCLIARQAIPDMPLCATTMGAFALFVLAMEDGDRAIERRHRIALAVMVAVPIVQALYVLFYFVRAPAIVARPLIHPVFWLPALALGLTACLSQRVWRVIEGPTRYVLVGLPLLVLGAALALRLYALLPIAVGLTGVWGYILATEGWPGLHRVITKLWAMSPITTTRQLYLVGCYFLLGVSVLAKGPPGVAVIVVAIALHVALSWKWQSLYDGAFEVKRGLLIIAAVAVPWHVVMFFKEGPHFVDEYLFTHILSRATEGVDNSTGTFVYYAEQLGVGMWLWAALIPAALVGAFVTRSESREGRVRILVALWAFAAVFVFAIVQTKFHHYILPAVPPLGVLVAFLLHDKRRLHPIYAALAIGIVLLVARDLMYEPDKWIEMFTYLYNRPWPPSIDPSDGFLVLGGLGVVALCIRRTIAFAIAGVAIAAWALHVYMPVAGTSWGMREAMRTYYEQRTIYGYHGSCDDIPRTDTFAFDTFIPDTLQIDQPMTLTFDNVSANGHVTGITAHTITVTLFANERQKLAGCVRVKKPVRYVDADRLIAWQLYWRGENFWSGNEIWGRAPELQTSFPNNDNVEFKRYLDRAPRGRRYFVIADTRIDGIKGLLPKPDTYRRLDDTSNKFSLASFDL